MINFSSIAPGEGRIAHGLIEDYLDDGPEMEKIIPYDSEEEKLNEMEQDSSDTDKDYSAQDDQDYQTMFERFKIKRLMQYKNTVYQQLSLRNRREIENIKNHGESVLSEEESENLINTLENLDDNRSIDSASSLNLDMPTHSPAAGGLHGALAGAQDKGSRNFFSKNQHGLSTQYPLQNFPAKGRLRLN